MPTPYKDGKKLLRIKLQNTNTDSSLKISLFPNDKSGVFNLPSEINFEIHPRHKDIVSYELPLQLVIDNKHILELTVTKLPTVI